MAIDNVDDRIAILKGQKFKIRVEDGTTPLNQAAPRVEDTTGKMAKRSVDVTVPSALSREAEIRDRKGVDRSTFKREISMDHVPDPDAQIVVGDLVFRVSAIVGFERTYTPGACNYQIVQTIDGEESVESHASVILDLLFAEMKRLAQAKKVAK
jgi:hypothetical protein